MKYCFLGSIYCGIIGKPVGGGELQLSLLVKYLNIIGEGISVIDFDAAECSDFNGITIVSLKKG